MYINTPKAQRRRAIVLGGEPNWCQQTAKNLVTDISATRQLWLSERAAAHKQLGRELDAVIFDAHNGFDADAFGAISGAIRGGGVLILLTPELQEWSSQNRFLGRFSRLLRADKNVTIIEQSHPPASVPQPTPAASRTAGDWRTPDQQMAITAVTKVATGQRRRPLVLTADRGRGKSAAFGIAAAQLLRQGSRRIVVTGPRLSAVDAVFDHAARLLSGNSQRRRGQLRYRSGLLEFVPPDELALNPRKVDLLLVDEAAALPTPLLAALLKQYARIAFATTVHGYEGSGRGFALRFHPLLERQTPNWRALTLTTPIRWSANDPLERFVFSALLLNAAPADDAVIQHAHTDDCVIERLQRDDLPDDETTLTQLFGLLVLAHYRTRPADLQQLLDASELSLYVMRLGKAGPVVATVLLAEEGDLDSALARAIFAGQRRLPKHLIPQALAAHAGLPEAAALRCARIMRIAVHPTLQRRGLGRQLVNTLMTEAARQDYDWLGASFGATLDLLSFWADSGLLPVRLGLNREASSGSHSAIVIKPLTPRAEALFTLARARFARQLPQLLADPLRYLAPDIAARLLLSLPQNDNKLDQHDRQVLHGFAFQHFGFEDSLAPLWQLTCTALTRPHCSHALSSPQRQALIVKVLQKQSWQETAQALEVTGRAQVIALLRQAVQSLCAWYDGRT